MLHGAHVAAKVELPGHRGGGEESLTSIEGNEEAQGDLRLQDKSTNYGARSGSDSEGAEAAPDELVRSIQATERTVEVTPGAMHRVPWPFSSFRSGFPCRLLVRRCYC